MSNQTAALSADLIIEAATLIERPRNWIKGAEHRVVNGEDCYCTIGALHAVARKNKLANVVLSKAIDTVTKTMGRGTIPSFNDAGSTTHNDVLQAMLKGADQLRAEA